MRLGLQRLDSCARFIEKAINRRCGAQTRSPRTTWLCFHQPKAAGRRTLGDVPRLCRLPGPFGPFCKTPPCGRGDGLQKAWGRGGLSREFGSGACWASWVFLGACSEFLAWTSSRVIPLDERLRIKLLRVKPVPRRALERSFVLLLLPALAWKWTA